MHREIYEHLEDVLSGAPPDLAARHLHACAECREEVGAMLGQAIAVRELKAPQDLEPRAGFYARVLERIEAEGPVSIWNLFVESAFGKRIALASLALALLLSAYLVSSERAAQPIMAGPVQVCVGPSCNSSAVGDLQVPAMVPGEDAPGVVLTRMQESPNDDMLVNLVTYREQ